MQKFPIFDDLYHRLLKASWTRFTLTLAMVYVLINLVFGAVYFFLGPEGLTGLKSTNKLDFATETLFFSVQTFSTIGYGTISPTGLVQNIIVSIEAFIGLMSIGLMSGLFFVRFSRPSARVLFSKVALITSYMGKPCVMFRLANARRNQMLDAQIQLYCMMDVYSPEGTHIYKIFDLAVMRSKSPIFALSWMVIHFIDSDSPFHNLDIEEMKKKKFQMFALASGHDEIFNQTIRARMTYYPEDFVKNKFFVDIVNRTNEDEWTVDIEKISEIKF